MNNRLSLTALALALSVNASADFTATPEEAVALPRKPIYMGSPW